MTNKTSITKAASNTTSLRTTVPVSIVKQFDLTEGDELEWVLVAIAEGKFQPNESGYISPGDKAKCYALLAVGWEIRNRPFTE